MNKTIEIIFDSFSKIKLMRFFIRNGDVWNDIAEISNKLKLPLSKLKPAINDFESAGFLKKKKISVRSAGKSIKKIGYATDPNFYLISELRGLVIKTMPYSKEKLIKDFLKLGNVKLSIIAGIFLNSDKKRVDLFIVGDKIKKSRLNILISDLEAQIGKGIDYSIMETKEFNYRYKMFDRFTRDILEYPNEKLINKMKI